jgi:hypothetical protein
MNKPIDFLDEEDNTTRKKLEKITVTKVAQEQKR